MVLLCYDWNYQECCWCHYPCENLHKFKFENVCGYLNDLLAKGLSALNWQLEALIRFRGYTKAIALDIKKFYNSVYSVERDQYLRRVFWNDDTDYDTEIFLTAKVNLDEWSAVYIAASAFAANADMFKDIDVSAANKLKNDAIVDASSLVMWL